MTNMEVDIKVDKVANMVADREVDKVADMVAYLRGRHNFNQMFTILTILFGFGLFQFGQRIGYVLVNWAQTFST